MFVYVIYVYGQYQNTYMHILSYNSKHSSFFGPVRSQTPSAKRLYNIRRGPCGAVIFWVVALFSVWDAFGQ